MRVSVLIILFSLLFPISLFAKGAVKKIQEDHTKKRWDKIYTLINQEMATIKRSRKKSQKLMYRLFELKSEIVKLYKEKENKVFMEKKLKNPKKIKRKDMFKETLKRYRAANKYGQSLLRDFPGSKFKAAIYYTMALNSRDFSYDQKELDYLRNAIKFSSAQSHVNYLARTSLAEYYYNLKKWKSANYQYEIVIKNQNDEWYTKNLLNFSWCLLKDHQFPRAINLLERSYRLSSEQYFVDVKEQAMTGLISFYVLGGEIKRGTKFIEKHSKQRDYFLLKLAKKSSKKGHFNETQFILKKLEKTITPEADFYLYANFNLFRFDFYKEFHKSEKLLSIAQLFPHIKFDPLQKEEAIRKISSVVGAKQVILKKDYSKYEKEYNSEILNEINTYFDILSLVNKTEKPQYEFFKAETFYSVALFEKALRAYQSSLREYDLYASKKDLRRDNMDSIFSCIDNIDFNKSDKEKELDFAYNKYLSYWPSDKKAKKIYPRLFNLYISKNNFNKMQNTLDRYITHFESDEKKQKELYRVQLDMLIKNKNTQVLSIKINQMQKGYLNFKKDIIKKSETILANILFNQFKELNLKGNIKEALKGYQSIHFTAHYPRSIKGEAAFNMGMIYTDLEENQNALKWYKKSFKYYSKNEKAHKRVFLEKMALRTSLLHNFLNASKLDKFILRNFCKEKTKNTRIFTDAINNDLANGHTRKVFYTLKKYKKCVTKIPLQLKRKILSHLFENKEESLLRSFISKYSLKNSLVSEVSFYYERLFWKYYGKSKAKEKQYLHLTKNINSPSSKLLLLSLAQFNTLKKRMKSFSKKTILIPKKGINPELFITKLTSRINQMKIFSSDSEKIFAHGHGQVSVLLLDELTKLSDRFIAEVNNYHIPIKDPLFQAQFKTEMDNIASSMKKESKHLRAKAQNLIESFELLITKRTETHLSYDILRVSDIRQPASSMAITFGLGSEYE